MSPGVLALDAFLPYRLAILAHSVSRSLGSVYETRFGITIAEWRIIANLGQAGPLTAGAIAERSSLDKPKVTRALKRLQSAGLVTRAPIAADRRLALIALTDAGGTVYRDIAVLARSWEADLLAPLDADERRAFGATIDKLMDRALQLAGRARGDTL